MDSLTSWTLLAALVAAGYFLLKSSETPPKDEDKAISSKTAIAVESDRKKKPKKKAKKDKKEEDSVPVPIAEKKKDIPKEKPTQESNKKPQHKAPVPMVNHALVNESSEEEEEPEAPRVLVLTKPKDPTARDSEWIQAGKSEFLHLTLIAQFAKRVQQKSPAGNPTRRMPTPRGLHLSIAQHQVKI